MTCLEAMVIQSPLCARLWSNIEDYTLSFVADHPDYILNIKDEDGEVVYSTTVFSAMTQVTLPSDLSGDYEIELLMGNWKFTGWIGL